MSPWPITHFGCEEYTIHFLVGLPFSLTTHDHFKLGAMVLFGFEYLLSIKKIMENLAVFIIFKFLFVFEPIGHGVGILHCSYLDICNIEAHLNKCPCSGPESWLKI